MPAGAFASLLRNDRAVVVAALLAVIVLAWLYLLFGAEMDMTAKAGGMDMPGMAMPGMMMPAMPAWTGGYAAIVFIMWAIMMVAMMLPSASPTILLVATLAQQRPGAAGSFPVGAAALFALGYVLVWIGFALVATALQAALSRAGMMSPVMATTDRVTAAGVLIAAGMYQLTPFKDACLRQCRSPIATLLAYWRPGPLGPLRSGLANGFYCLGCCWVLMALLFVGGIMNLAWIAGIALFVLIEKLLPWGEWASRAAGAVLIVWGAVALAMI